MKKVLLSSYLTIFLVPKKFKGCKVVLKHYPLSHLLCTETCPNMKFCCWNVGKNTDASFMYVCVCVCVCVCVYIYIYIYICSDTEEKFIVYLCLYLKWVW